STKDYTYFVHRSAFESDIRQSDNRDFVWLRPTAAAISHRRSAVSRRRLISDTERWTGIWTRPGRTPYPRGQSPVWSFASLWGRPVHARSRPAKPKRLVSFVQEDERNSMRCLAF